MLCLKKKQFFILPRIDISIHNCTYLWAEHLYAPTTAVSDWTAGADVPDKYFADTLYAAADQERPENICNIVYVKIVLQKIMLVNNMKCLLRFWYLYFFLYLRTWCAREKKIRSVLKKKSYCCRLLKER